VFSFCGSGTSITTDVPCFACHSSRAVTNPSPTEPELLPEENTRLHSSRAIRSACSFALWIACVFSACASVAVASRRKGSVGLLEKARGLATFLWTDGEPDVEDACNEQGDKSGSACKEHGDKSGVRSLQKEIACSAWWDKAEISSLSFAISADIFRTCALSSSIVIELLSSRGPGAGPRLVLSAAQAFFSGSGWPSSTRSTCESVSSILPSSALIETGLHALASDADADRAEDGASAGASGDGDCGLASPAAALL